MMKIFIVIVSILILIKLSLYLLYNWGDSLNKSYFKNQEMGTIPTPNIERSKKKSFFKKLVTLNLKKILILLSLFAIALYTRINIFEPKILQTISLYVLIILGVFFGSVFLLYLIQGWILGPIRDKKFKE